ncbi:signal peptidase II [Mycoplasmatota bacterium]|nr:signal peptidase II [Mycoplasmatota bacterium]
MKRPLILALILLSIDQCLKTFFQLSGVEYVSSINFGFTYAVNYALWINPNITSDLIFLLFVYAVIIWCLVISLLKRYQKRYRKSIIVDLAFAFYTVGILGNMIDKIIFGYIRDFILTPVAICNLADICGFIGLFTFLLEFLFYPKSRELLKFK